MPIVVTRCLVTPYVTRAGEKKHKWASDEELHTVHKWASDEDLLHVDKLYDEL